GALVDTTFDGKIIIGTVIGDSALGNDKSYRRICFTKSDNNGNIIWQKKYCTSYIENQLWSIKCLKNGKIVATGSRKRFYPEVPYQIGWIICTNSQGDSIWYREYTLVQGEHSWNFLYDIAQANDSGFIACGYINPVSPDPGPQNTWVIKVDSIGCESLDNCWVAVEEPESKSVEERKLTAFPNPATNRITFEMDGEEIHAGSKLTVYDIYGKIFYNEFLTKSTVSQIVDVSAWPAGIYITRLLTLDGVVTSVKFVIE
ncbi:MAG: T9SS type A sorting domain-containing protein, partial [Bacteroidales bacterium]|nr:T9SS type A sorting domain-containing protein [Bacteroidales bacterium]